MSVISDSAFQRDMENFHMSLGELCTYGQWHRDDPTMPLLDMIAYMTKLREEAEEEANQRAVEDWAFEEEKADADADAEPLLPCIYCEEEAPHGVCSPCQRAMDAYDGVECAFCEAKWTALVARPCERCHPDYIRDFRAAEEAAALLLLGSESSDEDMGWYNQKKAEWAAYAKELAS
jgi:hypothetical protein